MQECRSAGVQASPAKVGEACTRVADCLVFTQRAHRYAQVYARHLRSVAGRGLQPRPKRLTDEDMAVVIENGRDGGATPVPLWGIFPFTLRQAQGERKNP
ncbi:hypothetical protein Mettu_0410 [Methylobacter tundripaludum SV96]|uniref:Uncharacterized protein n=1 Tax=Methylobacter tundripaludum (strain ATCC BAA-1195 / DSM 17260 / SV96) TaxID=697282 RepID=G3IUV6_METTV|nr:hypothetical protein Mettu_0410 [Methylobacter tundripaludum SV96]